MLRKPDEKDACNSALERWRVMSPHWNAEADRFRSAAVVAQRTGTAPDGILDEIDALLRRVREALEHCDALIGVTLPGDPRLIRLVSAASDFEALLESLHGSRERIEDHAGYVPARKPPVTLRPKPERAAADEL